MGRLRAGSWAGLAAVAVLVAGALAVPVQAGLKEGAEAYQRNDFTAALKEWLPLAEAGDANALFNVAQLYRTGKGVEKDLNLAERFYLEAAERHHVAAQGNLGTLYYFAFTDSPRVELALDWWRRAAARGDARSQYMLGVLSFNGTDVARDPVRAYAWMRLAAATGLAEAVKAEKVMAPHLSAKDQADALTLAPTLLRATAEAMPEAELVPTTGTVAEPAPASGAATAQTGFYVQLASVGGAADARTFTTTVRSKFPDLVEGVEVASHAVALANGKTVHRVQAGPFATRDEARARCTAFKGRGQECFVVSDSR